MPKVIILSRNFPAYHAKTGEPTQFIEKTLAALNPNETYYTVSCLDCDWRGTSYCCGGGYKSIENPGNFSDTLCPVCNSNNLDENEIDLGKYLADDSIFPKYHTIRKGKRWKKGDLANLRSWSGKPYWTKQFWIAENVIIEQVYDLEIKIDGSLQISDDLGNVKSSWNLSQVTTNDGLSEEDFRSWFLPGLFKNNGFSGQIICWTSTDVVSY